MTEEREGQGGEAPVTGERAVAAVPLLSLEQAILAFNRRVLAQAERDDVPLLERLRYITIVSSNMDEFFEVRFADVLEAGRAPGHTPAQQHELEELSARAHELIDAQYALLNERVMPALAAADFFPLHKTAICRNPFATNLGIMMRKYSALQKVVYDGRGATFAEWTEYELLPMRTFAMP